MDDRPLLLRRPFTFRQTLHFRVTVHLRDRPFRPLVSESEAEKIDILGMVISVFHLPNMGGEKITLSISVLLALTFFLNLVSGLTPRNGFFSHWIISF